MWPDRRIQDLFGIELPIIQAPMAGPVLADMVVAVAEAGSVHCLAPCSAPISSGPSLASSGKALKNPSTSISSATRRPGRTRIRKRPGGAGSTITMSNWASTR